jgi:hypothetical protein
MANICITSVCNRSCSYCFAGREAGAPDFMSVERFRSALEFIERSGIDQVRLLGGEPTLHPRFEDILNLSLNTGKKILLFSNGLMSAKVLKVLQEIPAGSLSVLVNITSPPEEDPAQIDRQLKTLSRLGNRASIGLNIYRPDMPLEPLLQIIKTTRIQRSIRLGLALPAAVGQNRRLHPRQYPFVGARVAEFASRAAESGVRLSFDCGFVRCMFGNDEIRALKKAEVDFGWRCNPILDIDTAGRVLHCFPLAGISRSLSESSIASRLREEFIATTKPYRQVGVYNDCTTCSFKRSGECPGGCLAVVKRRFRPPDGP